MGVEEDVQSVLQMQVVPIKDGIDVQGDSQSQREYLHFHLMPSVSGCYVLIC